MNQDYKIYFSHICEMYEQLLRYTIVLQIMIEKNFLNFQLYQFTRTFLVS